MTWKGKLPVLDEMSWKVLYELAGGTLTAPQMRKLIGWFKPEVDVWMNSDEIAPLVQYNGRDKWYWLTGEGEDAVTARKALLDPNMLADRLSAIQATLQTVLDSGLNRKAVVALVHDSTGIGKRDIESVLDCLENIRDQYCK